MTLSGDPASRLERIDVLRGIAVLLVVLSHGVLQVWNEVTFGHLANAGVALFFVLSGFCIHLGFLRAAPSASLWDFVRRFWWRRFWRIYPAYFVALLVFWILTRPQYPGAVHFWSHLLLVHNLSSKTFSTINPAFWSLAAEWQIYLLYPAVVWLRQRTSLGAVLGTVAAISILVRAAGVWMHDGSAQPNPAFWYSPIHLLLDWMLGAWLAEAWSKGERVKLLEWLALPALAIIPLIWSAPLGLVFSFTLFALFFAGLTSRFLASHQPVPGWERRLAWVGLISYSLYLWHMPLIGRLIYYLGFPVTGPGAFTGFALVILPLFLVGSWASWRFIELPGIALGRFASSPSARKVTPSPTSAP